jgi:N-methylhydantoinase A
MGSVRIGIDIGGAFTDLVAYDESTRELRWVKVESTPSELSNGVMDCVRRSSVPREKFKQLIHGQTVVINTIIERKGAKVGLITTRGHRDILELQRGNRRDMYNFRYRKPESIVPRFRRIEVDERTMADGSILTKLNVSQVAENSKRLVNGGAEVILTPM